MTNPRGYVIHEDSERVAILTMTSTNRKTGDMAQLWVLVRGQSPISAVQTGADSAVCGDCRHRGAMGIRTCYVNVARAPSAVWNAWKRGLYPTLAPAEFPQALVSRKVRLGAYGDVAFLPLQTVQALSDAASGHTGYTHQWETSAGLKSLVMASVDTEIEAQRALKLGWRTFRVSRDTARLTGEIACPASAESGHRTTCHDCRLCDGAKDRDKRKSVLIQVHGAAAKRF